MKRRVQPRVRRMAEVRKKDVALAIFMLTVIIFVTFVIISCVRLARSTEIIRSKDSPMFTSSTPSQTLQTPTPILTPETTPTPSSTSTTSKVPEETPSSTGTTTSTATSTVKPTATPTVKPTVTPTPKPTPTPTPSLTERYGKELEDLATDNLKRVRKYYPNASLLKFSIDGEGTGKTINRMWYDERYSTEQRKAIISRCMVAYYVQSITANNGHSDRIAMNSFAIFVILKHEGESHWTFEYLGYDTNETEMVSADVWRMYDKINEQPITDIDFLRAYLRNDKETMYLYGVK